IPFDIFEKSPETRNVGEYEHSLSSLPKGSAVYLAPNVGPLFTQLGIMDDYLAKSKRCSTIRLFNEHREQDFALDFSLTHELYWNVFAVKDNKMCWSSTLYLDEETAKYHNNFRTTDWGEGGAEGMCNDVRNFPISGGDGTLTLGDLIDKTPKDQMAKVMLEEKVFDTWHHCRTVLIGDACHKLHPAGGQGATTAFQDAVALANWINALPTTQVKDLENAFKSYRDERHPAALAAEAHAKNMCKFYGKANDRSASVTRFIFKNMPYWLWTVIMRKHIGCRPQASFLPPVPNTGTIPPVDLPSYRETLKVVKAREAAEAEKTAQIKDIPATAGGDAVAV
ncbi:hypothetical protein BGZ91_000739, partial [Linnemannia elongata]